MIIIGVTFFLLVGIKVFSGTILSTGCSGALFSLAGIILLKNKSWTLKSRYESFAFFAYLILVSISFFKQFFFTNTELLPIANTFLIFVSVIIINKGVIQTYKRGIRAFYTGLLSVLSVYLIVNFFLFVIGITQDTQYGVNETLSSLLGISINRVLFPFAPNLAYHAMVAGVCVVLGSLLFSEKKKSRYIFIVGLGLIEMLLTDSRGPIYAALITLVFVFLCRGIWLRNQFLFLLLYTISAAALVFLITLISGYLDISSYARSGVSLLSSRDIVWYSFLENYRPNFFQVLFGYGNIGQQISGISAHYSYLFVEWPNPEQISLHNNTLQLIVDLGLVGTVLIFSIIYIFNVESIRNFNTKGQIHYLLFPSIICFILVSGFTDIVFNISNIAIYYITLLIIQFQLNSQND